MAVASDGVALGRLAAGQIGIVVWVRRAASAVAWQRCHLVCHWLQDYLPSGCRVLGPGEPETWHDMVP